MTDAEFWSLTLRMIVGVALVGGGGLLYVWNESRKFDRRFGRGPE